MKVVLVNDQLNAGGAERVLVNIANLLHNKGFSVTVLLYLKPSALDRQISSGVDIVYLNRSGRWDLKAMRRLKDEVKDADIVHIHSRYNLRYFMVAKVLLGIKCGKIVFHEHVPEYKKLDKFTAYILSHVDAYVAVQQQICNWVKQHKIINHDKVYFLPNIVNKPSSVDRNSFTKKKILMVGNFRRIKNQTFALEVLSLLGKGYTLDLFGMVDEKDYYDEVLEAIKNSGLQSQVHIIDNVTNIYDVLPRYHFALHTAVNETGPLVLLEYMNARIPFLTFDTGDVATILKSALPQLVMETFEPSTWVDRIQSLMCDEDKIANMQHKMEALIEGHYTEEKYWETLQHIYTKTVSN